MRNRFGLLCCLLLAWAAPARAQTDTLGYTGSTPRWAGQLAAISGNALLGGLTSGIIQELRGGSFADGFTRGALGGTVIYAGKRVAAERYFGAGLLGREVAAVGASIVRNASDGVGTLDRLYLPAGFTRVYWDRTRGSVRVKLDVASAAYLVYGVIEKDLSFDGGKSISAGTAVFNTDNEVIVYGDGEQHAAGVSNAGMIFRANVPGWGEDFLDRAFAHERIHVLQDDQLFITLNDHLDDWLFEKSGALRPAGRYIDLNGVTPFLKLIAGAIPKHGDRPWELEAIFLTR